MANPCGCGDSNPMSSQSVNTNQVQQDQVTSCPATVHEEVCVQADVTIRPVVRRGTVRSFCLGPARIGSCQGGPPVTQCPTFTVSQRVCVEIPLTFSANAAITNERIVCGTPETGPCPQVPPTFVCCQFIQAEHGTVDGSRLPSLSIGLCGPANQCSPQGNHINIIFPGTTIPNINLNRGEITSMTCTGEGANRRVIVTAQDTFGGELTNFTFTFTPNADGTVNLVVLAVNADDPTDTFTTTITLTANPNNPNADPVIFTPCQ